MERHLLVAAALREVLDHEPIVVGGTAEDVYTGDTYQETDLDVCGWVTPQEQQLLTEDLEFVKEGRHLTHVPSKVAVEFPESIIDGDEARVVRRQVREGMAAIIGVDDLYLDRVRQATVDDAEENAGSKAALAIALAAYEDIDWKYVEGRIHMTRRNDPPLGEHMLRVHKRVRRKMLAALRRS